MSALDEALLANKDTSNFCCRNHGQSVNQTPVQNSSDEKIVCANRSLVDLQGFKRLLESSGQSIVSPFLKTNRLHGKHVFSHFMKLAYYLTA